jgi:hypothetical protein
MRMSIEKYLDTNKTIYACFIDYNKTFDRVHHKQLIECFKWINLDEWDIRLICNLYLEQTDEIRYNGECREYRA